MRRPLTNEQFIERSNQFHGNVYDYSKVNYINSYTPVTIVCKVHGEFQQLPTTHLFKSGCFECGVDNRRGNVRTFIEKANSIHNNRYDYHRVVYKNNNTKVSIICEEHGEFEQTPDNHLKGKGCPSCFGNKRLSNNEFIQKANELHGYRYDYSKTFYETSKSMLTIICKRHGEFTQKANAHLNLQGCPVCKLSKGEDLISQILISNNISFVREYRVPNTDYLYRYDFYLPDHNLFIEFHGDQHYRPIEYFGGEEEFQKVQFRDNFKQALARELGVNILYFNNKHLRMDRKRFEQEFLTQLRKYS